MGNKRNRQKRFDENEPESEDSTPSFKWKGFDDNNEPYDKWVDSTPPFKWKGYDENNERYDKWVDSTPPFKWKGYDENNEPYDKWNSPPRVKWVGSLYDESTESANDSETDEPIEISDVETDEDSWCDADSGSGPLEPEYESHVESCNDHSDTITSNMTGLKSVLNTDAIPIPEDILSGKEVDEKVLEAKIRELYRDILAAVLKGEVYQIRRPFYKRVYDQTLRHYALKKSPTSRRPSVMNLRKSTLYLCILSRVLKLLEDRSTTTGKSVFYSNTMFYGQTRNIYNTLDDLCVTFGCIRKSLKIMGGSKGKVAGLLKYRIPGDHNLYDCSSHNDIPGEDKTPCAFTGGAQFLLIVEKESVFQYMCKSSFCERYKCILVTGKGQPDLSTRLFVHRLRRELQIPVIALVDCNPSGFLIMSVYKHGSAPKALVNNCLAVPDLKWLGILPSDINEYGIPLSSADDLKESDIKDLNSYLKNDWVQNTPFAEELKTMIDSKKKYQIEAFISNRIFLNKYLPSKLASKKWL